MRKKIKNEDKNVKFGITIHPDLAKILDKLCKEKKITKSKMIQDIMNDHFKKTIIIDDTFNSNC
jgi:metal-responsive CopG/Arc/MetJ family transcriptional regulator